MSSIPNSGGNDGRAKDPPYRLERLGVVMTPDPDDPREALGVLNPATARRDGEVFLFPRLVAEGNRKRRGSATKAAAGSRIRASRFCRGSIGGS